MHVMEVTRAVLRYVVQRGAISAASQAEMDAPGLLLTSHGAQLPLRGVLWLFIRKLFSQCAMGMSAALAGSRRQGTVCASGPLHSLPCSYFLRCLPCMHCSLALFWILLKALPSETFLTTPFKIITPALPPRPLSPITPSPPFQL